MAITQHQSSLALVEGNRRMVEENRRIITEQDEEFEKMLQNDLNKELEVCVH